MSSAPDTPFSPRRRVARGPARPQYLASEEQDKAMMIVTAVLAELSVLRDRLDTHEALAEQGQVATAAAIEAFTLDPARAAQREAARVALLARVFRSVTEEVDAIAASDALTAG